MRVIHQDKVVIRGGLAMLLDSKPLEGLKSVVEKVIGEAQRQAR